MRGNMRRTEKEIRGTSKRHEKTKGKEGNFNNMNVKPKYH